MSSDATASSRSTDGFLKRAIEGAPTYSREEGQFSLTGAVKRMISGPGKEERGFMQRIKAKEMDEVWKHPQIKIDLAHIALGCSLPHDSQQFW
jgi:hypothetical protein